AQVDGNDVIAVGYDADGDATNAIAIGNKSFVDNNYSIAIGQNATATQAESIAIGAETNVTGSNAVAIGYQAVCPGHNEVHFGNSAVTSIGGSVNWTATSDGRFKKDVREDVPGLDFINRLHPVTYNFDSRKLHEYQQGCTESLETAFQQKENTRYTGFIAQEVEEAAKASNYDFSGVDTPASKNDVYGLRYAEFSVPMVKAVQELDEKVKSQEARIEQLLAKIKTQQEHISALTKAHKPVISNNSPSYSANKK
ncbi:MAG: tail fiber domain-containing protein, partial [Saprospiraceae bacterium]|nr:tail fiber domain-containing protein [Saprospiraceae bacterium]